MKLLRAVLITILPFTLSHATSLSVWNSASGEQAEFCDHVTGPGAVSYNVWFDNFVERTTHLSHHMKLENSPISNLIVLKPPFIHCHAIIINIVVQTTRDNFELRTFLKHFGMHVAEITKENINVMLNVHPTIERFTNYTPNQGIYIIQAAGPVSSTDLPTDEKEIVMNLARRRHIDIVDVWKKNNCIYIDVDASHGVTENLERYKEELQSRLPCRSLIVAT